MERRAKRISELKYRIIEITQSEQQREDRLKKLSQRLRDLWDYNKSCNICVTGVPEGEKKEDEAEKVVKETMTENTPNWQKT